MLRTKKLLPLLDQATLEKIAAEFQPRLLKFRFENSMTPPAILPIADLEALNPRTRDLGSTLIAPIRGRQDIIPQLLATLKEHDQEIRHEQSLELEWLTVEALFALCHDNGPGTDRSTVGGITSEINRSLKLRGERLVYTARKISVALRSLGIRPTPMGNLGSGLLFTSALNKRIHELAQQFDIDRRTIAVPGAVEDGYGGAPCPLCEELGMTGGLKLVDRAPKARASTEKTRRGNVFDYPDQPGPQWQSGQP